jgi:hypothetical protein
MNKVIAKIKDKHGEISKDADIEIDLDKDVNDDSRFTYRIKGKRLKYIEGQENDNTNGELVCIAMMMTAAGQQYPEDEYPGYFPSGWYEPHKYVEDEYPDNSVDENVDDEHTATIILQPKRKK